MRNFITYNNIANRHSTGSWKYELKAKFGKKKIIYIYILLVYGPKKEYKTSFSKNYISGS